MAKKVTLVTPGAKAHYSQSQIDTNFDALNDNFDNFLHLGGTGEASNSLTGNLDMGTKKVTNAGTPSLSSDLATKGYVDSLATLAATGTLVDTTVQDADNDTGVQTEATTDLDRLDLFAATSGGADNAIEVTGDDGTAASLANPYVKILKHVVLDTGVRIGDAASANTYLELNRSGSTDHIYLVAGGNDVLELDSSSALVKQHVLMYDNAAQAAGKRIGDQDGDTYIIFNEATGGTDDDTIRLYAGGVEALTITSSTVTFSTSTFSIDDLLLGGSSAPGDGEDNYILFPTGTTVSSASSLNDNTVLVYSSVVTGVENKLNFDFKTGTSTKATVVLGEDCSFPNDVSIGGDVTSPLTVSDSTDSTTKDTGSIITEGGIGVEKSITVGVKINVDTISEKTSAAGVTIDGFKIKDTAFDASVWPSFFAYLATTPGSNQDYSSGTKINFDTEDFDTNSDYDHSTNYRFTPTVAGKYLLSAGADLNSNTAGNHQWTLELWKNGSLWCTLAEHFDDSSTTNTLGGTVVVDANGSTDYFECYINNSTSATAAVLVGNSTSGVTRPIYFSGSRIA